MNEAEIVKIQCNVIESLSTASNTAISAINELRLEVVRLRKVLRCVRDTLKEEPITLVHDDEFIEATHLCRKAITEALRKKTLTTKDELPVRE